MSVSCSVTALRYAVALQVCIARAERDGTRAESRIRLSSKRTSPFKSVGASVQSTAGSLGVRIGLSNDGYTTLGGGLKVLATHSIRQFPLHFPSRASPVPPGSERALPRNDGCYQPSRMDKCTAYQVLICVGSEERFGVCVLSLVTPTPASACLGIRWAESGEITARFMNRKDVSRGCLVQCKPRMLLGV